AARSRCCCVTIRPTTGRRFSISCAGALSPESKSSAKRFIVARSPYGAQGIVTVEHAPEANALRATVRFPKLSSLPPIIARLRRVFDLGADPAAIAAHLAQDPVLSPLVKARPGLRVPGNWDGFELAIRAVLGQQITVVAARGLAGKLVA